MTVNKALQDLLKVAEITHEHGNYTRMMLQQDAIREWFNRWIIEVNAQETVLHKEYLTSEYKDFIREKLVHSMVEELTEECAEFSEKEKTTRVRMYALRRGNKP